MFWIGTHRLLQKDVIFRDLGLVVVDEEHRFGVSHKEKLKEMRRPCRRHDPDGDSHPRTLQMSLSGIRDSQSHPDPPENRLSIRTIVARYDDEVIREAIERELQREDKSSSSTTGCKIIHAVETISTVDSESSLL